MTIETLISTMHQTDHCLLKRMNIQTDAIVINQCERNAFEQFEYNGYTIKWYDFSERGVGLSRNSAIMRAMADIVLFADDDLEYIDGYAQSILDVFEENKKADMIIFDVNILNDHREIRNFRKIEQCHSLYWYNSMRYGACRIAMRRNELLKRNVYYSLLFGGGARYSSGEDSLFIRQCLSKKMKAIAYPLRIAKVDSSTSTWYEGANEKYYMDKGILLYAAFPLIYPLIYVYYAGRYRNAQKSFIYLLKTFFKGRSVYIDRTQCK